MTGKLRPLAKCRVPDMPQLRASIQLDVRRCMRTLSAARVPMVDVANALDVHRRTLYRWADGELLPDPVQIAGLRWLTAQWSRKAGT